LVDLVLSNADGIAFMQPTLAIADIQVTLQST